VNTREFAAALDELLKPLAGLAAEHKQKVERTEKLLIELDRITHQDSERARFVRDTDTHDRAVAMITDSNRMPRWQSEARERAKELWWQWCKDNGLSP
jgi:hypothetical protein